MGQTLAEERLGTILHEMLHAFLNQYICQRCVVYGTNGCDHGRAWQIIAKGIEEQSLRLLGVEVDLGRLDSMWADRRAKRGEVSTHDLEVLMYVKHLFDSIPHF
jgi:hypothetical protein